MNISDYISQNYDVLYSAPASSLEECSVFLLGEIHGNTEIRKINSLFINTFGGEFSTVLLECQPCLRPAKFMPEMKQVFGLEAEQILGWDDETVATRRDSLKLAFRIAHVVIDKIPDFGRKLTPTNWEEGMTAELKRFSETELDEESNQRFSDQVIEKAIKEEIRNDDPVYKEEIRTLAAKLADLEMSLTSSIKSQLAEIDLEIALTKNQRAEKQRDINREGMLALDRKWMQLVTKKTSLVNTLIPDLKGGVDKYLTAYIKETFAARTRAMIHTLKNVQQAAGKIFLIAGIYHLEGDEDAPSEFSLESFREFLKERADVAVLKPKSDDW